MINLINILHDAVRVLCPTAITVRGYDVDSASAYDADEKELNFDKTKLAVKCIELKQIDTSFLVATLTAAIQELKAEFDEYKKTHP